MKAEPIQLIPQKLVTANLELLIVPYVVLTYQRCQTEVLDLCKQLQHAQCNPKNPDYNLIEPVSLLGRNSAIKTDGPTVAFCLSSVTVICANLQNTFRTKTLP